MVQSWRMIGVMLNVTGIVVGGVIGRIARKPLTPAREAFFKVALGAFTVFYGLRLTWMSLSGPGLSILRQLLIVVLALMLGSVLGRLLRLQKMSNGLGQKARVLITAATADRPARFSDGFNACAILFCAAPLGIVGAIEDGLSHYPYPLAVKAMIDGLAAIGFVSLFGWSVLVAAVPVFALQGTIALVCSQYLEPVLRHHQLVDSVNATAGLLVFTVALVILQLKKIALADYLPSLIVAPLLTKVWH